jgi:L-alanine-DL-glutamate epimerase-like enolase superfamily enzyme
VHIRELSCFAVEIPTQSDEYVMSRGRVLTSFPSTVVKVVADDGTTGYGEACTLGSNYLDGFPASAREAVRLLADWVFECDVFEPNVLVDGMDALIIGNRTAKAAIDIAMWDVRGKLLGRPVAQLLGGIKQRTFPAFKAISIDTPTAMAREVTKAADFGYRSWQIKLGEDPIQDAARTRAVADAVPADSSFITSDANTGWTVAQALRFSSATASIDMYIEQPCATIAELARLRRTEHRPLMVDEIVRDPADALAVLAANCADAINLKLVRVGGLTKAARIRDIAQSAGWMVLVDDPQGADISTAAQAHLAATITPTHLLAAGYFMGEEMRISYQRPGAETGPRMTDGLISLVDLPGLGLEIDDSALGDPVFTLTPRALAAGAVSS